MTSPNPALRGCSLPFDRLAELPKNWCAENPVWSKFGNRVFIVVAELELFINRVCLRALEAGLVQDPEVEATARELLAQEAAHTCYHDEVYAQLRRCGYEVDSLVHRVREEIRAFEASRGLPELLSVVAGMEHIAASVGAWWLREGRHALSLPKEVRTILGWRAVVGLRHHGAVFALYRAACAPGYLHRLRGLVAGAWFVGHVQDGVMAHLNAQELLPMPSARLREERRRFISEHTAAVRAMAASALCYLCPGFSPKSEESVRLAEAVYAAHRCEATH
ncbi:MAG: metal-dependent hydrolase [Alphaproteobacteria bacterium]|nr:metal-dependent hydrolase [Alphaproteobacteria bacterium]MCB9795384.1 metal-dependent hydrolase [Alphaproteobacteria bacterium]